MEVLEEYMVLLPQWVSTRKGNCRGKAIHCHKQAIEFSSSPLAKGTLLQSQPDVSRDSPDS